MTNKEFYTDEEEAGTTDERRLHGFLQQLESSEFECIMFSDDAGDIENAIANIRQQYQCWLKTDESYEKEKTITRLTKEIVALKKQNALLLARVNYYKFNDHKTITHKDAMSREDRLKIEWEKRESKC